MINATKYHGDDLLFGQLTQFCFSVYFVVPCVVSVLYLCRQINIYFIYVQHINHRMQVTQKRSEYDWMTNSVEFMQQTSSPPEGNISVCD